MEINFEEEMKFYDRAYAKGWGNFSDENNEDETYTEDQLLEDFTFLRSQNAGLKVRIDTVE
jgi:hypothetical protein